MTREVSVPMVLVLVCRVSHISKAVIVLVHNMDSRRAVIVLVHNMVSLRRVVISLASNKVVIAPVRNTGSLREMTSLSSPAVAISLVLSRAVTVLVHNTVSPSRAVTVLVRNMVSLRAMSSVSSPVVAISLVAVIRDVLRAVLLPKRRSRSLTIPMLSIA